MAASWHVRNVRGCFSFEVTARLGLRRARGRFILANPTASKAARRSPHRTTTMAKKPSPNDQRSDVKNPNNPQHDKAHGNRGAQKNPNRGGSGGSKKGGK